MDVKEKVLTIIRKFFLPEGEINTSENLLNIGIDSITFMMLLVNLEEEFKVEFDDSVMVGNINSIDELCATLESIL